MHAHRLARGQPARAHGPGARSGRPQRLASYGSHPSRVFVVIHVMTRTNVSVKRARKRLLAGLPVTERRLHGPGEFAATWLPVLPQLVRTHHVIVPDRPGHGASPVLDGRLDAGRIPRWLGEPTAPTCPAPPVLVGRVVGATIVAQVAIDHPDPLSHLVLVDTLGLTSFPPDPRFKAHKRFDAEVRRFMHGLGQ